MEPGGRGSLLQGFGLLPSQQTEVQRLKEENQSLVAAVQSAEAMGKRYYENWIGTFPQLKNLKAENEELRKKLKDIRKAIGILEDENENLKTKFSIPSKRASSKTILGVPLVTAVSCTHPKLDDCLSNMLFRKLSVPSRPQRAQTRRKR